MKGSDSKQLVQYTSILKGSKLNKSVEGENNGGQEIDRSTDVSSDWKNRMDYIAHLIIHSIASVLQNYHHDESQVYLSMSTSDRLTLEHLKEIVEDQ